jgi:hypothetical protein
MRILRRTCCTAFFVAFLQAEGATAQSPTGIVSPVLDVRTGFPLSVVDEGRNFVIAGRSPSATIVGTVTLTAADGGTFAAGGARVVLACRAHRTTRTEVADDHGAFRFLNVPVDSCSIEADVQGFVAPPVRVVTAARQVVGTDLHLGIAPLRVGVSVGGSAPFQGRRRCPDPVGLTQVGGSSDQ